MTSLTAGRPRFGRLPFLPPPSVMASDVLYLALGLPLGVASFTVAVTGLSLAVALAITMLGFPVLFVTLLLARWFGAVEAARLRSLLGVAVERAPRPWIGNLWVRFKTAVADGGAWRDLLWGLLLHPLGVLGFTVAVTLWATAVGLITSPAWWWAIPEDDDAVFVLHEHTTGPAVLRVLIGLALVPVAAWACRGLTLATAWLARALLRARG
ncbi:MAG: sensor domain-containing protein [Solirubrobacterales bacterium]|nr:sensor domain-containing protein [Solirubrobacterales bacterium]